MALPIMHLVGKHDGCDWFAARVLLYAEDAGLGLLSTVFVTSSFNVGAVTGCTGDIDATLRAMVHHHSAFHIHCCFPVL